MKHFCSGAVRLIQRDKQSPIVAVHLVNTNQINYVRLTYRRSCRASLLCRERHEIGFISGCRRVSYESLFDLIKVYQETYTQPGPSFHNCMNDVLKTQIQLIPSSNFNSASNFPTAVPSFPSEFTQN